jgi:hypothetical protein
LNHQFSERQKASKRFQQLNDFFKSDVNGFWREVKKMRRIKQLINIPIDKIKKQYKDLFNSSNFPDPQRDKEEEEELKKLIDEYKKNNPNDDEIKIKEDVLEKIIKNLKNGKATGFSGVSNEMLKNGWNKITSTVLKQMYEWMINTGSIPKLFNISILKPLIKDESKASDNLNNLRPLSISDIYTNVFEKLLLLEVQIDHPDHDKQFGFRANASCGHANFILSEIVKINKSRNKATYIISIDASKAFDRVGRNKLWITMFKMKIRPKIIIALKNYYSEFLIIVNNGNDFAAPFNTSYGVKQGGCISPELYKLYGEPLAIAITLLCMGVKIKNVRIDILMYADDIILVANDINEAQTMLDVVTEFSSTNQVKFNPDKTHMLVFNKITNDEDELYLCGERIVKSNSIKYLGVMVNSNFENIEHIEKRRKAVYASMTNLITTGILNNEMNVHTKLKMFKIYLKPLLYYGVESINISENEIKILTRIEGNVIKQLLNISKHCETKLLYAALDIELVSESILKQQYKFFKRIQTNEFMLKIINEMIEFNINSGLIGKFKELNKLDDGIDLIKLNQKISDNEIDMMMKKHDRRMFNNEVGEIIEMLNIPNQKYRSFKLNKRLNIKYRKSVHFVKDVVAANANIINYN